MKIFDRHRILNLHGPEMLTDTYHGPHVLAKSELPYGRQAGRNLAHAEQYADRDLTDGYKTSHKLPEAKNDAYPELGERKDADSELADSDNAF
jgi:hypothetical protein